MARSVNCIKLGIPAEGLDFPPYPGELGKRIWESVSKEAWAAWLKHQTMLVNENRLSLADARARQYLARQMENHFWRRCRRRPGLRPADRLSRPGAWLSQTPPIFTHLPPARGLGPAAGLAAARHLLWQRCAIFGRLGSLATGPRSPGAAPLCGAKPAGPAARIAARRGASNTGPAGTGKRLGRTMPGPGAGFSPNQLAPRPTAADALRGRAAADAASAAL